MSLLNAISAIPDFMESFRQSQNHYVRDLNEGPIWGNIDALKHVASVVEYTLFDE